MNDIGKKIRELRLEKGMTQAELGRSFGGDKMLVYKYETGKVKNIPRDNVIAMAHALDVHPAYLFGLYDLEEARASRMAMTYGEEKERESVQKLVLAASHLNDAQVDALTTIAEQMRR